VKRRAELRDLSEDHHTGLVLARKCRQAGRPDSELSPKQVWEQVVEAFAGHLEPHFEIEEEHLLPALEAIGEVSLASRIRADHAALRELHRAGSPSRSSLERFGELLETHIRFEERQVLEPTQDRLPPRALESIAAACQSIPRVCLAVLDP